MQKALVYPSPDDALAASAALSVRIGDAIDAAGGWLGFDRYMSMALYEPAGLLQRRRRQVRPRRARRQ